MSVYVINGLREADSDYIPFVEEFLGTVSDNVDLHVVHLDSSNISPCLGCFGCWIKTPGICVIDDEGRDIARNVINSDRVIFISPITFGGFTSVMKRAVDRLIPNLLPYFKKIDGEIHHKQRYEKRPEIIGLGLMESADFEREEIFREMFERIATNMGTVHKCFFIYNSFSEKELKNSIQEILAEVN